MDNNNFNGGVIATYMHQYNNLWRITNSNIRCPLEKSTATDPLYGSVAVDTKKQLLIHYMVRRL